MKTHYPPRPQRRESPSSRDSQAVSAGTRHEPRRRFRPAVVGFWLGGLALTAGGCILGACMPYRHPVAVAISVLWWGIYLGFFGASVGALLGWWADRTPASPPHSDREACHENAIPPGAE
jgi:hypothetical protein